MSNLPFPDEERLKLATDAVYAEMRWIPIIRSRVLRYIPRHNRRIARRLAEAALYAAWLRAVQPPKTRRLIDP